MPLTSSNLLEPPSLFDDPVPTASAVPQAVAFPAGSRVFGDADATRSAIFDRVYSAASSLPAVSNKTHTLQLSNVEWVDPDRVTKRQRKEAVLRGETLGRRLRGQWTLIDNATGKPLDQRKQVIASVPYLTDQGTFVHNGNEYVIKNQQRLRAGVYTRVKDNGEIESHANVLSGGPSHRYELDPAKGVFYIKLGQSRIPLMPLLQTLGAKDSELREAWGPELYAANYSKGDGSAVQKLMERLVTPKDLEAAGGDKLTAMNNAFNRMTLDSAVTQRTLGKPFDRMNKDAILATTRKLLAVSRNEQDVDDRDHLAYQNFMGPEDVIAERLSKDRAGVRRQLLFKLTGKGNLSGMPSSALQKQINSAILESGLGQALEEINPAEVLDRQTQISRLGEGGIPSIEAVPDEARSVQPSHFGFMDPLRTPESFRVGVDVHLASNTRKGTDGKLYAKFRDVKTGADVWKTPQDLVDTAIAFPGALKSQAHRIPAMKDGKIVYVPREEVQMELPQFESAFSPLGNMIPLKSTVKGQRMAMASRMTTQALPLSKPEAPLVQSGIPGSNGMRSYEDEYGSNMGAVRSKKGGQVLDFTGDELKVRYDDGTTDSIELYNNHPYNRKTYVHQTPVVQPGQRFGPNAILARSNYTDDNGTTALGVNARVAYLPWGGKNFEDAIVISDSMAKRFTSEHMYQHDLAVGDRTRTGKNAYVSLFPSKYDKSALAKLDDKGVIKVGTEVSYGDPIILAAEERSRAQSKVHKQRQAAFLDRTVTWEHSDPGIVTDVMEGKNGPVVLVKSVHPMQVGDKMSGRYGDKGVVAAIVPDGQMPHDKDGKPYEVLLNPLGVISRTNPAQMIEAALGKLAAARGKPIKVADFDDSIPDMTEWANRQLKMAGMSSTEDVVDPQREQKIKDVATGVRFFMKLQHTAESKGQGRGSGGYTAEDTPAKGGETGSKRLSLMDVNALLSHGATEVLRDVGAIRGQRNEDYWLQFMSGYTPREPKVPLVYQKFVDELKAAGINVVRKGTQTQLMAMTDKDVDALAGDREIKTGDTVKWNGDLEPIEGGLFDKAMTGGHHGRQWAAVRLTEPMPNPVMEEPIRRVLNLTKPKFEDIIAGKESFNGLTGPKAIHAALDRMHLGREIAVSQARVLHGSKSSRDDAVRKLAYLKSAQKLNIHPRDWFLKRVPVLPSQFRPISLMEDTNVPLVADPNYTYKELIDANDNLRDMKDQLGDAGVGEERLALYNAFKGVTGLGDPISQKSKDMQVRGLLKAIFGSSPKFGTVQRKLISSTVDNVGRAVITPNPDMDMDTVGLPEDRAFDVYQRFIVRRLKRKGMPMIRAMQHVRDRSPLARQVLLEEMDERPVIINRAPVLHRFGIMAFKPTLTKGETLQISPLVVKGFGADFDGDAMQYHVPTDDEARKEAIERMLPSRQLLNPADFKSPVHVPGQEYVGGLYVASARKSERPVRTFRNAADVARAWKRGEISATDSVRVLET